MFFCKTHDIVFRRENTVFSSMEFYPNLAKQGFTLVLSLSLYIHLSIYLSLSLSLKSYLF
jgi:hypothetical protein